MPPTALTIAIVLTLPSVAAGSPAPTPRGATTPLDPGRAAALRPVGDATHDGDAWILRGVGSALVSVEEIGRGDAVVTARLSGTQLQGSAASFLIGGSHFGFSGRDGRPFVEGPLFGGAARALDDLGLQDGTEFELRAERRGGELRILVDGVERHVVDVGSQHVGPFGLRAHRAALRVTSVTSAGDLAAPPPSTTVFRSGTEGYHTFRIPALLATAGGAWLAFAEGRRDGAGDAGDIDVVLRRSVDGGRTWGPLQVIFDDGAETCGNPCVVQDRETGTIWLLMTRNLGRDREPAIIAETSDGTRTVWVASSDDDGETFSAPREITGAVKRADWTWYATGPGAGIQLSVGPRAGRLVIPCDHIEAGTRRYLSHVVVSDDHGLTWRLGGSSPQDQVNECQIAELDDGRLVLNMRSYDRERRARAVAFSTDGGDRFVDQRVEPALVEPICHAGLAALPGGALAFSNPASAAGRVRMTLRISRDGGASWPMGDVLWGGPAAYSCLAASTPGAPSEVACLFEAGDLGPYEAIRFHHRSWTGGSEEPGG